MERTEQLWGEAYLHAARFLGRYEDAFTRAEHEDLVQDSTLSAWQWAGSVREPSRFPSVVRTIARRKRCHALREHHRRRQEECTASQIPDEEASGFTVLGRKRPRDWLVPRLMRALVRLKDIDRCILLASLEGFCHAEIADRYHLTCRNVRVRMYRARRRVRMEIEDAARAADLGEF